MLKNKFKLLVAILTSFALIFSYSVCFADENAEEISDAPAEVQKAGNDLNSDLYAMSGETLVVDYNINGNAFIMANSVSIKSQISGDAFIMANSITIEEGASINNNLFALGDTITVNGSISDLYSCGSNITIGESGYVFRDIHIGAQSLNILGTIGKNAFASVGSLAFTSENNPSHGTIYGNLNYLTSSEENVDQSEYVLGDVNFTKISSESPQKSVMSYFTDAAKYVITAVIIYLLVIWLAPKFKENSVELLTKKIGPVIGFGLLGVFVIPFAILILLMLGITSKIAFALLSLYIALLLIASSAFIIAGAGLVANKRNIDNKWRILGLVCGLAIILWAVELIPFIGGLISFITVVLGTGLIVRHSLPTKAEKSE